MHCSIYLYVRARDRGGDCFGALADPPHPATRIPRRIVRRAGDDCLTHLWHACRRDYLAFSDEALH